MSIIYLMIPLALVLVGLAVWALVWAIRSGQFDELESQGWTPVLDDDERPQGQAPDGRPGTPPEAAPGTAAGKGDDVTQSGDEDTPS